MNRNKIIKDKTIITILTIILLLVSVFLIFIVYDNYDYLMFKTIMTKGYTYNSDIQDLIDEELNQTDSNINTYFDDAVISIFTDKLHEVNNDIYTHIYLPVQYTTKLENEQKLGDNCRYYNIAENTSYLSITNFTDESVNFIKENADEISKTTQLVLDLRGNPGGYVKSANKIADLFLDKGNTISVEKAKFNFLSKTNKSTSAPIFNFNKIVILQDKNTASAAEILIGALHDNLDNVVLMGETTYGKGIGQYTVPLKNKFYFVATMFTWETPNGTKIHKAGIKPDIEYSLENLSDELGMTLTLVENKE